MNVITIDIAIYTWIIFWTTYWTFGGLLTWKARNVRRIEKLYETISILCWNMLWTLLGIILLYCCPLRALTDSHIIIKFIFTYIIMDVWFYHVHIMLHHPQLYSKIHKLHHHGKMVQPYALTALHCTIYEAIFLNVFATSLGPIIFQIPPPYLYLWYFFVALNSVATHSGLSIPFFIDGAHDIHHRTLTHNYGISIYFDWIYGTDFRDVLDVSNAKDIKIE